MKAILKKEEPTEFRMKNLHVCKHSGCDGLEAYFIIARFRNCTAFVYYSWGSAFYSKNVSSDEDGQTFSDIQLWVSEVYILLILTSIKDFTEKQLLWIWR